MLARKPWSQRCDGGAVKAGCHEASATHAQRERKSPWGKHRIPPCRLRLSNACARSARVRGGYLVGYRGLTCAILLPTQLADCAGDGESEEPLLLLLLPLL